MRAVVTGAAGFAGSHLVEHLLAAGDRVLACTADGLEPRALPSDTLRQAEWLTWDISQATQEEVRQRLELFAPDAIYHLAAISVPADCGTDEPNDEALAVNVRGTAALIDLAAELPSRPRVLLTSSSKVYAPVTPDMPRVSETAPLHPVQAYGKTKLAAETLLLDAVQKGCIDGLVARSFNHAGPRQSPRFMLAEWAQQVAAGGSGPLRVHSVDAYLDLADVRDIVRAYRLLVEYGQPGGAYNVGTGSCRRSGDVLQVLLSIAACDRPVEQTAPGRRQHPIADITRLVEATGWQPEIPLERTVADVLGSWRHSQLNGAGSAHTSREAPGRQTSGGQR